MLVYQDIIESIYQENGPVICGTGCVFFFENLKFIESFGLSANKMSENW